MNVLIIGLGSIARKHIAALHSIVTDNLTIYALRSSRLSHPEPGVTSIFSLDEINGTAIDFAIISSPTSVHAADLMRLEKADFPLMIEKPLFDTLGHDRLVESIDSSGRLTYVACNLRFLDALRFVRDAIALETMPGAINEVNAYCGSALPSWRPGTDWRQCYSARPEMGGGVHLDLIHEIDYLCWIFGFPTASRAVCRSASTLGIRAIDYANYCLIYPGFCASAILNYYRPDYRRTLEIVMDRDIWTVDIARNTVTDRSGAIIMESKQTIADTYCDQMKYFIGLVNGHAGKSFNNIATAYMTLKITNNYERFK